jgi:hypothetical protein
VPLVAEVCQLYAVIIHDVDLDSTSSLRQVTRREGGYQQVEQLATNATGSYNQYSRVFTHFVHLLCWHPPGAEAPDEYALQ